MSDSVMITGILALTIVIVVGCICYLYHRAIKTKRTVSTGFRISGFRMWFHSPHSQENNKAKAKRKKRPNQNGLE